MPPRQHHAKPTMTRAANRTAYAMWLHTAPLEVVARQRPASIAGAYGIPEAQVTRDIADEPARREREAVRFAAMVGR